MRKFLGTFGLLVALFALMASSVSAYTLNPDGTGSVSKGEVQSAVGINNAGIQSGTFQFRVNSVSETTWLCRHTDNPNAADQERSNTTTTQGVVASEDRVRGQIVGWTLTGYSGTPSEETSGSALNSCPNPNRAYVEGSTETELISGGLQVSYNGGLWITLP